MVGIENVLLAAESVFALVLTVIAVLALLRDKDVQLALLAAAFGVFFLKALLLTISLFTLADYHLRFLEKHELITSAMDGEYKRFYPRSTPGQAEARPALSEAEKQILAFLRQPVPLKVIDFLMEREAATHKEILEQVPVTPSTL